MADTDDRRRDGVAAVARRLPERTRPEFAAALQDATAAGRAQGPCACIEDQVMSKEISTRGTEGTMEIDRQRIAAVRASRRSATATRAASGCAG